MAIRLYCPSCENRFQIEDSGDEVVTCPECGVEIEVRR